MISSRGILSFNMPNMNEEKLKREAQAFGEHLARLLAVCSLSIEQKQAWAALVSEMTLEQMVRFAKVLEKYVDASILPEMADLRSKLEAVKRDYDVTVATLGEQAQTELNAVMAQVKAAEAQG